MAQEVSCLTAQLREKEEEIVRLKNRLAQLEQVRTVWTHQLSKSADQCCQWKSPFITSLPYFDRTEPLFQHTGIFFIERSSTYFQAPHLNENIKHTTYIISIIDINSVRAVEKMFLRLRVLGPNVHSLVFK